MLTIGLYGDADPLGQHRSHDHGVAVMENGELIFSCELERFTGIKHDGRLNQYAEQLLEPWLNSKEKIRWVLVNSFMSDQFTSENGLLQIEAKDKLFVEQVIIKVNDTHSILTHEMAHIGTCLPFYGNFKPNSLLVHIDGGASNSSASAWYFDGREIQHLDHSWHSKLKVAVNNFNANPLAAKILNVNIDDHLAMPGKLMGYAGFGKYSKSLHQSLVKNNWYIENAELVDITGGMGADIACCMQRELEEQVLSYIRKYQSQTGASVLYYSGGAALNIHANVRIERELKFDIVCIPPAPSDCGLALGAAAFLEWLDGKQIKIHSAYLNSTVSKKSTVETMTGLIDGVSLVTDVKQVAEFIAAGEVVAVFAGDAEIGPRALGHRSLLIRPDSIKRRKHLSEVMKQREWYRPVAPIMLEKIAESALLEYLPNSNLSRFMLGAWTVAKEWQHYFSGCLHADNTVRAQVIDKTDPEINHIYQLLMLLHKQYKIQGVINTSFNSRGMPIVGTFDQAIAQAKIIGAKYLWCPSLS
ncbi:MAG: carbamoyltransferase C-terminal domain-containing protein [Colwellia sp.]